MQMWCGYGEDSYQAVVLPILCKEIIDTPETHEYIKKLSESSIEIMANDFIPPVMVGLEDKDSDRHWICKMVNDQLWYMK
jgi:hypothetical protein